MHKQYMVNITSIRRCNIKQRPMYKHKWSKSQKLPMKTITQQTSKWSERWRWHENNKKTRQSNAKTKIEYQKGISDGQRIAFGTNRSRPPTKQGCCPVNAASLCKQVQLLLPIWTLFQDQSSTFSDDIISKRIKNLSMHIIEHEVIITMKMTRWRNQKKRKNKSKQSLFLKFPKPKGNFPT